MGSGESTEGKGRAETGGEQKCRSLTVKKGERGQSDLNIKGICINPVFLFLILSQPLVKK